jgi:hypothetical protein
MGVYMANGLFTNEELIDSLIVDLNSIPKLLIDGQGILFCSIVSSMGQKLVNLKKGIKDDLENKNKVIEELKRALKETDVGCVDMTPEEYLKEKDGAENGGH